MPLTPPLSKPKRWKRLFYGALATLLFLPAFITLIYILVPVPITPLMIIRSTEGMPITKNWVALDKIAPELLRSVIVAEDATFCTNYGFEADALEKAWDNNQRGGRLRGGSTITMQTAKNVFLWPDRSFLRKGLEAWLTVYVQALWSKPRTMEVYLNVLEWGPGIYGAEAAARHHFNKSAAALSPYEAALLASVLPSPRRWSASKPGPYVRSRAETIQGRAAQSGDLASCVVENK
jgi:monofunctional biosynthetic peptidoglycan transglycosylase